MRGEGEIANIGFRSQDSEGRFNSWLSNDLQSLSQKKQQQLFKPDLCASHSANDSMNQ
jgi:hypothetical protein